MDAKTMEWMKERLRKSEAIRKEIDYLNLCIQKINNATRAEFVNFKMNENTCLRPDMGDFYRNAITAMAGTFKEVAEKEVERLEKEFAEI